MLFRSQPFADLCADPEVMRYFPAPLTRAQADDLAARIREGLEARGFGLWALERRDSGEFIGFTGLIPMPDGVPGEGGLEVGWRLASAHWRQGFATEAARAAVRFWLDHQGGDELNSIAAVLNEPSQGVMRKLGMREADRFDHPRVPEGPLRPHVRYVLSRR